MTTRERFSGADTAWLRMDTPESPMVIVGFFEVGADMTVEELRKILTERLLVHDRFRQRVDTSAPGRPVWEDDPDFDMANHVRSAPTPRSEEEFSEMVADLTVAELPRDRPLWECLVISDYGAGTALLVKLHHSIADGIALLQILLSMADDVDAGDLRVARVPSSRTSLLWRAIKPVVSFVRLIIAMIRLALLPPDPRSALRGRLTGVKHTAWTDRIPLDDLLDASRHLGVTVNDLLLASMSGAIRNLLERTGRRITREIRAMVPFNLRPPEVGRPLGNKFGLVLPALPVSEPNPLRRLERVRERMLQIKRRPEAAAAYTILNLMGMSADVVESLIMRFFGTKVSLVLTNVPGPDEIISLGGHPIERIMFWVPQAAGLGLGVSLLSYAGSVTVGVISDTGLGVDADDLVEEFDRELARFLDMGHTAGPYPYTPLI